MQPLDAVPWAELEHAYGAAVDVPDWIRTLAAGGPPAERAAGEFSAALHHQGSYFPATPVAVPYLVDALRQPGAARVTILYLLAELSAAHIEDVEIGFDPYTFRSDNDYFDYPEAQKSIAAVRAGYATYLPLLGDADPSVRAAAAYLIVGCPDATAPARSDLLARVHTEPDPVVRASHVLALGRLGVSPHELAALREDPDGAVRAAVAIVRTRLDPRSTDNLGSLVDAASVETPETVWGVPGLLAARAIAELARVRPADAEAVLRAALDRRLAAGHRPIDADEWYTGRPTHLARSRDQVLRALVTVLTPLVFGDLATRERLATRDEVTAAQSAVLRWTVDFHLQLPVRAIPWFDPERMRRFLDAPDGPLERPLTVARNGTAETAPTWFWLCAVDDLSPDGVRDALLEQRTPQELVALARDALGGAYVADPMLGSRRVALLGEVVTALASEVESALTAWARELGDDPRGDLAAFVVMPLATLARARGEVLDESFDAAIAASLGPEGRDWLLEPLSVERRTRILPRLRSGHALNRLLHYGDPDEVARRVVSALATRPPGENQPRAGDLLRALGVAAAAPLRAALDRGDLADPRLFADVLAEIEGRAEHVVSIVATTAGLILRLSDPGGQRLAEVAAPRHPRHDDLTPLVAALPAPGETRLSLEAEPDLDHATVYRLQQLFGEFLVRSVRAGGSTLSSAPGGTTLTYGSG